MRFFVQGHEALSWVAGQRYQSLIGAGYIRLGRESRPNATSLSADLKRISA
jgi:hypothetical protein